VAILLPNKIAKAAHVSHVNGICNTGNNVFNDQIPNIGPIAMAITISAMPSISLISADVIAKIPPNKFLS